MAVVAGYGQSPHYQQLSTGSSLYASSSSQSQAPSSSPVPEDDQYTALFCKALYDYTAQDASALSFRRDDIIEVLTQQPSGWWDGLLGDERGWFPSNYVTVISEEEAETILSAQESAQNPDSEPTLDFESVMLQSSQSSGDEWLEEGGSADKNPMMELADASLVDDDVAKPSDFWMPEVTMDGQVFYVNTHTGQRSRDLPREADEEASPTGLSSFPSQSSFKSGTDGSSAYGSSTLASSSQGLDAGFGVHRRTDTPEPWVRKLSDDGRSYYYWNQETDQVQWTRPEHHPASTQQPSNTSRLSPSRLRSDSVVSDAHPSAHSRTLSVYSDDSDIQPPELAHLTRPPNDIRSGSKSQPSPAPGPYARYEYLSHALQQALAPTQPEILSEMSATTRNTIQVVIENASRAATSPPFYSIPEAHDDQMDASIRASVVAVRDLLYVSGAPSGHIPSSVLSRLGASNITPSSQAALKPVQRRVTATLSKLVLSARAMEYEYGTQGSDASSRIESDADELARAIVSFVAEAERHSVLRDGEAVSSRRLHGTFLPPVFGMGAAGCGSAGSWTGFGFTDAENEPRASRKLDTEVLSELDIWFTGFDKQCVYLIERVNIIAPVTEIQSLFRGIIGQLSMLASFVANLHVAALIDIDGVRESGPITNETYNSLLTKAKQLLRKLEAVVQSVYDDTSSMLLYLQTASDGFSSLHTRLKSVQANLSLIRQTISLICSVGAEQSAAASDDFEDALRWRRSRMSMSVAPDISGGRVYAAEDAIGFDGALEYTRAPPRGPSNLTAPQAAYSDRPPDNAPSHLGPPAEDDFLDPDGDLGEDFVEEDQKPKRKRAGTDKLTKLLGPDAPKHIMKSGEVDAMPWYLRPSSNDIVFDGDGTVRGGTLPALVERLTSHDAADSTFNKNFLMTFKSFTSVNDLFDLLVERFFIQPPPKLTPQEREQWGRMKQHIVRMRVLNAFKSMITDEDILQQEDLVIFGRMKEFLARPEVSTLPAAKHLNILIDRGRGKEAVQRKITALQAPPPPIIPKNNKKPKLLEIDPLELARQLTIVESELYQKITPVECIQRAREQKDDYNDSIATVIQTSNKIADWVAVSILNKEDSRRRAACLKQFIAVADKCRMLQNFSTMVAITSGLNTTPIRRLKRTWEHVTPKSMAMLQACEKVLESARNYNSYRSAMANVTPPCVPFIGVFLTTLTFIQDGAKDNLPGNMINFRKRTKAAEVIQDIKRWQAQPFLFTPVPSILAYITESLESKYDGDVRDVFWNLSLEREPREREDERMARLLQESGFL